jgi:hypothetical protein
MMIKRWNDHKNRNLGSVSAKNVILFSLDVVYARRVPATLAQVSFLRIKKTLPETLHKINSTLACAKPIWRAVAWSDRAARPARACFVFFSIFF